MLVYRMCRKSPKIFVYGKCPKNLNTKVSDKMKYANSADPDQELCCLPFH